MHPPSIQQCIPSAHFSFPPALEYTAGCLLYLLFLCSLLQKRDVHVVPYVLCDHSLIFHKDSTFHLCNVINDIETVIEESFSKAVITQAEIEAFYIVTGMLVEVIPVEDT